MNSDNYNSVDTLRDIKSIMERSARFISLSGWSGIWAGCVGLAGAYIGYTWLYDPTTIEFDAYRNIQPDSIGTEDYYIYGWKFIGLAIAVLAVALLGGLYFTWNKAKKRGQTLWNAAGRRMLLHMAVPLLAGGIFSFHFLQNGHEFYIAPAMLIFYGLALINGSKYTLSDIKYLGYLELVLGFITLFLPGYGLLFWTLGFGGLHIIYGIIMWNKYDKNTGTTAEA